MNKPQRIGIYGGTFDPIHRTHLDIARAARDTAGLDKVVFVVAARPPHKQREVYASAEDRLALVQAAIAGEKGMEVSRIEMDRIGPSYTVDTLREIHQQYPEAALFLIVGYDSLVDLPSWHKPEEILGLARVLAARRPGVNASVHPMMQGRFDLLPIEENAMSSTEIRARVACGESVHELVPAAVEQIIREKGLYREPAGNSET